MKVGSVCLGGTSLTPESNRKDKHIDSVPERRGHGWEFKNAEGMESVQNTGTFN